MPDNPALPHTPPQATMRPSLPATAVPPLSTDTDGRQPPEGAGQRAATGNADDAGALYQPSPAARAAWRREVRGVGTLLAIWALVTVLPLWFARDLDFLFLQWPFPYWMASYGAPLAYLGLVLVAARGKRR